MTIIVIYIYIYISIHFKYDYTKVSTKLYIKYFQYFTREFSKFGQLLVILVQNNKMLMCAVRFIAPKQNKFRIRRFYSN